jgi:hypothetical protein
MSSPAGNQIERRSGQRFPYQVPVMLRVPGEAQSGSGCTQDLSSRGAMVWTEFPLIVGQMVDMTFVMPSEITLADDMSVCCRARVVRREQVDGGKPAIAVQIEHYDFLHRPVPVVENTSAKHTPAART